MATPKNKAIYNNGDWKVKNLKFLVQFMQATNNTTSTIAQAVGVTRQAIYNYLLRDDMSTDFIFKIMDALGFKISFKMMKKGEEKLMKKSNVAIKLNDYFYNVIPDNYNVGKLYFIQAAMQRYHFAGKDIAEKLGIGRNTVCCWFARDCVMISHVYNICKAFDLELKIDIEYIEGKEEEATK